MEGVMREAEDAVESRPHRRDDGHSEDSDELTTPLKDVTGDKCVVSVEVASTLPNITGSYDCTTAGATTMTSPRATAIAAAAASSRVATRRGPVRLTRTRHSEESK